MIDCHQNMKDQDSYNEMAFKKTSYVCGKALGEIGNNNVLT